MTLMPRRRLGCGHNGAGGMCVVQVTLRAYHASLPYFDGKWTSVGSKTFQGLGTQELDLCGARVRAMPAEVVAEGEGNLEYIVGTPAEAGAVVYPLALLF